MTNKNILLNIERLLQFAVKHSMLEKLDIIPARNALLDLLQCSEPYSGEVPNENVEIPADILSDILDYAVEKKLIVENTTTYRDLFAAKIMGLLMPRESEVAKNFYITYNTKGAEEATNDFYALSQASYYIPVERIRKNLYWQSSTSYGNLEITVNLSKPEKDPKEIAASKLRPQSNYPKCLLCIENVGYAGHVSHPARQNHRVIPVTVSGEQWYLQYSPYVYYNEHCILFKEVHEPMKISQRSFERLLSFIEQFPHYFIGSNADLPIVGGSILSHEHFQGGRHVFPMEIASTVKSYSNSDYPEVKASILKWPLSVIRISSKNKDTLIKLSSEILAAWREYSDESSGIRAYTINGDEKTPHNTITPIARENNAGEFEMDLVLRNNRTSEEHPDGIYHPHKELHHIKKENIGLIEVMGLAVLPARLNTELKEIEKVLCGDVSIYENALENSSNPINKHTPWIKELIAKYGMNCSTEDAEKYVKQEVGEKFSNVLSDAGVYKMTESGINGFDRFMTSIGFK